MCLAALNTLTIPVCNSREDKMAQTDHMQIRGLIEDVRDT